MFSGFIQDIGQVKSIVGVNEFKISIYTTKLFQDLSIGTSIAINGVCQTAVELENNIFSVFASKETINTTNLAFLQKSDYVNLELPCTPNTFLNGHIVQGHVDTMTKIDSIKKRADSYILDIKSHKEIKTYAVKKGSISIDGISLTIQDIISDIIRVTVIPHTFENTTLKYRKKGDLVNIETDILAKYIKQLSLQQIPNPNSDIKQKRNNLINQDFLKDNGFF